MCLVFKILAWCRNHIVGGIIGEALTTWWLNRKRNQALYKGAIRDLSKWDIADFGNSSCPFPITNIQALCDAETLSTDNQKLFNKALENAMICASNDRGNSLIGRMKGESKKLIQILEHLLKEKLQS